MPIDTTPSTVATNALNAIDYSALIGGPMDAIVKAQAMAAKTTYEFINEVGLTVDPDTNEKKPVNVVFQYNNGGQLTTLTVPLITVLAIPVIEVTNFTIDFIANISAASSSMSETSNDTELTVDATAEASLGIGPFSVSVKAQANYSSKQHSKAAQDSKYSVEYTMNVHVEGGQAGLPAGLQTVLNILQGSSSSISPDEQMAISPAALTLDRTQTNTLQTTIKNGNGLVVPGAEVTVKVMDTADNPFDPITLVEGSETPDLEAALKLKNKGLPLHSEGNSKLIVSDRVLNTYKRVYQGNNDLEDDADTKTGYANDKGIVGFEFKVKDAVYSGTEEKSGTISVTAKIPKPGNDGGTYNQVQNIVYVIIPNSSDTGGEEDGGGEEEAKPSKKSDKK
ncbi:DUF2589 domain-containing protein [Marinoscillum pacificum]|uniref:DUF2589 domain-containing protein n=1 Tax=Marinoscillum pacificum TaxID=392723 RepID=UPI002157E276|nr:DUF2589 domain-containing protein [Marinoscillum pacificum]